MGYDGGADRSLDEDRYRRALAQDRYERDNKLGDYADKEYFLCSDCCGAEIQTWVLSYDDSLNFSNIDETGICPDCKDHCGYELTDINGNEVKRK